MLKLNDKGIEVVAAKSMLYTILGVEAEFGDIFTMSFKTLVHKFQKDNGLTADGIIGAKTFAEITQQFNDLVFLQKPIAKQPKKENTLTFSLERVVCDVYTDLQKAKSFSGTLLRGDAALALEKVKQELNSYGAILTTSGGLRALTEKVSIGRSATSLHYTGIAFDLYVPGGMLNTTLDPYVVQRVVKNNRTSYIVWARCNSQRATASIPNPFVPADIVTYASRVKPVKCEADHFVNLTDIFNKNGFSNIHAHKSFETGGSMMGSEWWHFQYDTKLVKGVSTFGEELRKIYSEQQLLNTPPDKFKDCVWGVNWN